MTPTERLILTIYGAIVAAWPIRQLVILMIRRRLDFLSVQSPRYDQPDPPLVSAIIPAKDEQETLPDCLASVRAQSYPRIEILVVDDRSADRTAEIARAAAGQDPRVRLISISELPAGWTGKTHALQVASSQAAGAWLWFIDADTRHHPDSLSIMLDYARRHGAKLASLLPEMRCESFWERVVQPLCGIVLMRTYPLFRVNNDRNPMAFANGQYILIERAAYDEAGGHQAVRDRFVEDIFLARRVKALGHPIRTAMTTEISSTRMYTNLSSLIRGWSRILYDAHDRRPWPLVGKIVEPLIFSQSGDLALILSLSLLAIGQGGAFASWLLGMSVVHQVLKQGVLYQMYGWSSPKTAHYALLYPLAGIISAWILIRALWICLTGKVTWRGTAYGPGAADRPASS